jgi:DNA-binding NarL/FixJ family response regulator
MSGNEEPARLVIVDDHDLVRDGLKAMLSVEQDMEVVGEASDGADALSLCQKLKPDLALMDVRMPKIDGLAATRTLKRHLPQMSVLILTVHENQDYMLEAVRAGASGYVLKDTPREELTTAIRKVLEGEAILNQHLATQLVQRFALEIQDNPEPPSDPESVKIRDSLSNREREVLVHLARGQTNRTIAAELFISVGTVKNHVEHIFNKLEVSDRTQAVVRAFELKIVPPSGL